MRPAHKALAVSAAVVIVYNVILAPDGETISEGFDELLDRHPLLTQAAIVAVACHVANRIPERTDPLALSFGALRALRRRRRWVIFVESKPA